MKTLLVILLCSIGYLSTATGAPDGVIPAPHLPPDPAVIAPDSDTNRIPPPVTEIVNPAEFCRADGIVLAWAGWEQDFITEMAWAVAREYLVYMIVRDSSAETEAASYLDSHGVNLDNVVFVRDSGVINYSMWVRDYGPYCINADGTPGIVGFWFYGSLGESTANLADFWELPCYESPMRHQGGDHISDGNGMAFASTDILNSNPTWSLPEIRAELHDYLGIDSLVIVEPLVGELTKHIDVFCKLLSDTLFVVGEYMDPSHCYPGDDVILDELAAQLDGMYNLQGREFHVERVPMAPLEFGEPFNICRTYLNSTILNDMVLVPAYGYAYDVEARAIYQNLMPDHEIVPINSASIIYMGGAAHCASNALHSADPLIVLHEELTEMTAGGQPLIRFSLNPGFLDMSASVFWKPVGAIEYAEVAAQFHRSAWKALLPEMNEDFDYYIHGQANSGEYSFSALLPLDAPDEPFTVTMSGATAVTASMPELLNLTAFPNPFNPQTTITFELPRSSNISLTIYDVSGHPVRTLVDNEVRPAGRFQTQWSGRDESGRMVASGVYFYRLETPTTSRTKRLTMLK